MPGLFIVSVLACEVSRQEGDRCLDECGYVGRAGEEVIGSVDEQELRPRVGLRERALEQLAVGGGYDAAVCAVDQEERRSVGGYVGRASKIPSGSTVSGRLRRSPRNQAPPWIHTTHGGRTASAGVHNSVWSSRYPMDVA
jgi:hypothetical protein